MIFDLGNGVAYEHVALEMAVTPLDCELFNARAELKKSREESQFDDDSFKVSVHFTSKDTEELFLDGIVSQKKDSDEELEPIYISAEEFKEAKSKFSAGILTITNCSETKMEIGWVNNEWIILSGFIEKRIFNALISLLKEYDAISDENASLLALS